MDFDLSEGDFTMDAWIKPEAKMPTGDDHLADSLRYVVATGTVSDWKIWPGKPVEPLELLIWEEVQKLNGNGGLYGS